MNDSPLQEDGFKDEEIVIDPREISYMLKLAIAENEKLSVKLLATQARVKFYEDYIEELKNQISYMKIDPLTVGG